MSIKDIPFDKVCGICDRLSPDDVEIREKFRLFLEHIRIRATDRFVVPPEVLKVDGITIGTIGNFSASVGKPKSRKTFNMSAIAAALLSGKEVLKYKAKMPEGKSRLLYVDTEQSRVHCHKVLQRILRMSGLAGSDDSRLIEFLMLREFTPQERRDIIEATLQEDPSIGFVVIDGLRDLTSDINSPVDSSNIINDVMRWSSIYGIHIHTALHLNKGDDNTRGHLGTELNNKAETVIKVSKCEFNPDVSEVQAMITREKDFQSFAFRIDEEGLPVITDIDEDERIARTTLNSLTEENHRAALDMVFADGKVVGYTPLVNSVMRHYAAIGFRRGRTSFVMLIKLLTQKGVIRKVGREYWYKPANIGLLGEEMP